MSNGFFVYLYLDLAVGRKSETGLNMNINIDIVCRLDLGCLLTAHVLKTCSPVWCYWEAVEHLKGDAK
jgi:hypothetical protein